MSAQRRIEIAPSILSADFSRLGEEVRAAEEGGADLLHIDVMDGRFVPNITVGPLVVRALRPVTALRLQAHLMIVEPERYIDAFAEAGADLITLHTESCQHLHRALQQVREAGAAPSICINPATPLVALEEVLDVVDMVLLMTVDPGFGGQEMLANSCDRVRRLRAMLAARGRDDCRIEVDGGINRETIGAIVEAGADVLVMGAALFQHPRGVGAGLAEYRALLQAGA